MEVIFLNGATSSGKTSIAIELQEILPENYLHIGIDTFIKMMPCKTVDLESEKAVDGFYWEKIQLADETEGFRVRPGEYGQKVNHAYRSVVVNLVENGLKVIVDDVSDGGAEIELWKEALTPHSCLFVGVHCDLDIMESREKSRGDRKIYSAREQYYRVHRGVEYDFLVNTSNQTPELCAKQIANRITGQSRQAF